MELAWQLVREGGTESLTLGRPAELAGVAKPVVYDHFESRTGLLIALYEEFDARQNLLIDEAIAASGATLTSRAKVIAGVAGVLGAAEALSRAAVRDEITAAEAKSEPTAAWGVIEYPASLLAVGLARSPLLQLRGL